MKNYGFNKTKILIFLFIIVILGGGGSYYFQNKTSLPKTEVNSENTLIDANTIKELDKTTNWETYKNEEYGFYLSLPNDWREIIDFNSSEPEPVPVSFIGEYIILVDQNDNELLLWSDTLKNTDEWLDSWDELKKYPNQQNDILIGDMKAKEIIMLNKDRKGSVPGNYNYLIEKDNNLLVFISLDEKTDITMKILSTFRFTE